MSRVDSEQLRRGACLDLPLAVVDKYFNASPAEDYFAYQTARAICGRCAVRAMCLVDVIQLPAPTVGVRGGEAATTIAGLRRRYFAGDASAETLATEALLRQHLPGTSGSAVLRAGQFPDARPIPLPDDGSPA